LAAADHCRIKICKTKTGRRSTHTTPKKDIIIKALRNTLAYLQTSPRILIRGKRIYLSNRTIPPMSVAPSRINMPAENKIGVANPRSSVISLSGFGNLPEVNVASKKPSG